MDDKLWRAIQEAKQQCLGAQMLEEKYGTKVYSVIAERDILSVINK